MEYLADVFSLFYAELKASSKSSGNMGAKFRNQLEQLQKNLKRKTEGPTKDQRGISVYFDDDGDDDNSDFDDDFGGDTDTAQGKSMMAEEDPSKLIDIELVNLLKFCNELKVKH